jgi:hypothetical protein
MVQIKKDHEDMQTNKLDAQRDRHLSLNAYMPRLRNLNQPDKTWLGYATMDGPLLLHVYINGRHAHITFFLSDGASIKMTCY